MNLEKIVCCVVVASGCYTYAPAALDDVPLQSDVKAVLSTAGEIGLRERVGLMGGLIEGELIQRSDNQILIAIPTTGPFSASTGERFYQRVDIPRADVLRIEVKEPSTSRTVALLVGSAGAATAIAIITFKGDRNPGQLPGPGPGPDERPELMLPALLRIP